MPAFFGPAPCAQLRGMRLPQGLTALLMKSAVSARPAHCFVCTEWMDRAGDKGLPWRMPFELNIADVVVEQSWHCHELPRGWWLTSTARLGTNVYLLMCEM